MNRRIPRYIIQFIFKFMPFNLFTIVSSLVLANPVILPAGKFVFQNQYEIIQTSLWEIVDRKYQVGEMRFQELRKLNFNCELKMNQIYKCQKFTPLEMPTVLNQKILTEFKNRKIIFQNTYGPISMIEENEIYKMWKVPQKILFDDMLFNDYRIYESENFQFYESENFQSIWMNQETEKKYLNIRTADSLTESHEYDFKNGSQTLHYLVYVVLSREKNSEL